MAQYDLFIGQTLIFTSLYLLVIQVPTFYTLEALANLPMESSPAASSDIAEFAGEAPADGIPIALGVSSPESQHKIIMNHAMVRQTGGLTSSVNQNTVNSNQNQIAVNVQNNKGGSNSQPAEPIFNDQTLLEQKLKLLQLIDQLGFDEAISSMHQMKANSQGGGTQPARPITSKPTKPKTHHPKIQTPKPEPPPPPPPTILIPEILFSQPSEDQPQMEAGTLEKYSGKNSSLEQSVSMTIPRNQNNPNPTNLAQPPHHQTNVYIQQTKFHNKHKEISDRSNTQNEQVIVASPVLTTQYEDDDKDEEDYDSDNDKGLDDIDENTHGPLTDDQFSELFSQAVLGTEKPIEANQRKTTVIPKRATTTRKVIPTRKPTTKSTTEKLPFDLLVPEEEVTERTEIVTTCPTFLEFVVEAQVFWNSLKQSAGIINSFELVVQAIVQSMKTLGRCFYRVSTDVIQVILDFFGVKEDPKKISAKRDANKVKISHR